MKFRRWSFVVAVTLLASVVNPGSVAAQDNVTPDRHAQHHHYKLIDIPALGGPNSSAGFAGFIAKTMNPRGTVVGEADTSTPDPFSPSCFFDCLVMHPAQWRNGVLTDLGALSGVNSSAVAWINSRGWASGLSENGVIDPLTGFPETSAVLWKDGEIINLGTLGGNVSGANALNNRGQVVGGALNTIPDPFSATFATLFIKETFPFFFFPVATQAHAFLWQNGAMQDLGTLGGPDSVAWFVNERGQVAGQSTINSIPSATTGVPPVDPFFWDDGKMVDVGNFGGTFSFVSGLNNRGQMTGTMKLPGDLTNHPFLWDRGVLTDLGTFGGDNGVPNAINDAGEIVGFAGNQGNQASIAFLWKHGVMINLGTLDVDQDSAAHSINAKGQVVGESSPDLLFSFSSVRAFLWENGGPIVDLNTLIPPGSGMQLKIAASINDRGEIDGDGVLPNGDTHAFLLIPCDEDHPDVEGCDYDTVEGETESAVRPAQITHAPTPASGAKLSPAEMMTRFRSLRAGRNHRFGTPQTSPK
jgi:probable HAF family extracellular repeat protein